MKSLPKDNQPSIKAEEHSTVPVFAYELLRDVLIPELLGSDTPEISYWAGKYIARRFPLLSIDEAAEFFKEAGWGHLYIVREKKNEFLLELSGDIIERRLTMASEPCFRLEAGFLAEQVQSMKEAAAETFEEIHKKELKVLFRIQWDA
ncbi:YslB family protein [Siminovitchia sediminis]|uniref:YslB family protein n=1 Tax=Siminovitchia sediminis TaxID=1274353 RepID=A0ABW4KFT7_9BACI